MNFLVHISVELFDEPMPKRLRNTDLTATRFGMVHVDDTAHSPMMAHINHSRHIYNARNIELIGDMNTDSRVKVTTDQIRLDFLDFLFH